MPGTEQIHFPSLAAGGPSNVGGRPVGEKGVDQLLAVGAATAPMCPLRAQVASEAAIHKDALWRDGRRRPRPPASD
eukprot:7486010-Alexandrium_andersonii.AAC.1